MDFTEQANENTVIIAQIENVEGIRNIDGIMSVDGIDLVVLGPSDLSFDLGAQGMIFIAYNTDTGLLYRAAFDGLRSLKQGAR